MQKKVFVKRYYPLNISNFFRPEYFIIAAILLAIIIGYIWLADKYNIIDKPNERSSHTVPTIRGGGIIFPLAVLLFGIFNSFQLPYLIVSVLLTGVISFIDDLKNMPSLLRFAVHILAAILILYEANAFTLSLILVALAFIFVVGMINAFNFMDGINGITGFYAMAVVLPLLITETNRTIISLEIIFLIALMIFLFFNARVKARCFAGDVGSVTIAVTVCFLIAERVVSTYDFKYLAFVLLYLVDTGLTLIQRAIAREKVFQAHRKHLFQVLSNEMSYPHLRVALLYGVLQLIINFILTYTNIGVIGIVIVFAIFVTTYIVIKLFVLKKVNSRIV